MLTPAIIQEIRDADQAQRSSGGHHAFDLKVFLTTGASFRGHVSLDKDGQTVRLAPRLNNGPPTYSVCTEATTTVTIRSSNDGGTADREYLIDGSLIAYTQAADADEELYG